MKTLNEKVRKLREGLKLSQDYVARYLGISRSLVTQLENGHKKIFAEEIQKLCELFGVSSNVLFGNTELSHSTTLFEGSFKTLDETDQTAIINLIRFKEQMKVKQANNAFSNGYNNFYPLLG